MKKNSRKAVTVVLCVLAILAVVSGIYAYFTDTQVAVNKAKMGVIKIDLEDKTLDADGNEVEWTDIKGVTPGSTIDLIPYISLREDSEEAYIRAKVEILCKDEAGNNVVSPITLNDFNVGSDWITGTGSDEGYYFYKNVLKKGEKVCPFTKITIPANISLNDAGCEFTVKIVAEAIQARNFEINASVTENVWGGITPGDILDCVTDSTKINP